MIQGARPSPTKGPLDPGQSCRLPPAPAAALTVALDPTIHRGVPLERELRSRVIEAPVGIIDHHLGDLVPGARLAVDVDHIGDLPHLVAAALELAQSLA